MPGGGKLGSERQAITKGSGNCPIDVQESWELAAAGGVRRRMAGAGSDGSGRHVGLDWERILTLPRQGIMMSLCARR
jgi:hypothetical protein